jgi:hypothetical protein
LALLVFHIYGVIIARCDAGYIDAYGFILCGWAVQLLLFWLVWLLCQRKVHTDFPRIIAAAFFGVAFNVLFKGLSLTISAVQSWFHTWIV